MFSSFWNSDSDSAIDQTWQHVAVAYDGSLGSNNLKLYVNETLEAQDNETDDNTHENHPWQIGAHGNSAYEWVGDVDEVRLYKETLSADWIKFEYRNIAEADNELTWAAEEDAPEASPPSELIGNPYMFTGRRFDLETGLYYYRARYYNPYIGRFLQTDPMGYGDGMNWYNYCGSNPLNYLDPSGEKYYYYTVSVANSFIYSYIGEDPNRSPSRTIFEWLEAIDFYYDNGNWVAIYVNDTSDGYEIKFMSWIPDVFEPPKEPDFVFTSIADTPVVVLNELGRLNDRVIINIMDEWFENIRSQDRHVGILGWFEKMIGNTYTPFRSGKIKYFLYWGKEYNFTAVNYIGWGYVAAHFDPPWLEPEYYNPTTYLLFYEGVLKTRMPDLWNLYKWHHLGGDDQYWYNMGYTFYYNY